MKYSPEHTHKPECANRLHTSSPSHEQAVASRTLVSLMRGQGSMPLESERQTHKADIAPRRPNEDAGHCKTALWPWCGQCHLQIRAAVIILTYKVKPTNSSQAGKRGLQLPFPQEYKRLLITRGERNSSLFGHLEGALTAVHDPRKFCGSPT